MANILIVEDTEFYIKSLTDILESGGHKVTAAMNTSKEKILYTVEEALEIVRHTRKED